MTLIKSAVNLLWSQQQRPIMMMTFVPGINLKITRKIYSGFNYTNYMKSCNTPSGSSGCEERKVKAWNEAASVMIVAPMNNSLPHCLGYLMMERSRVMPGNWAFPGGNADSFDADPHWITLFRDILNIDVTQDKDFLLHDGAHHPQIYLEDEQENEDNEPKRLPKQISLRITAIRETFEEAGVLLCRPGGLMDETHVLNGMPHYSGWKGLENKSQIRSWQKKVRRDSCEFLEMCRSFNCVPDLWGLHDWSNWLTPTVFKPRQRYDMISYMVLLPKMVRVVVDGSEAFKAQWISPSRVLEEHASRDVRLMPPQVYEFSRLMPLKTLEDLKERFKLRRELGIERYFPVMRNAKNGTLFLLPGDDMYPEPPDYIELGRNSLNEIPKSVEQLMEGCSNLHRGIARKDDSGQIKYEINVKRYGNIY